MGVNDELRAIEKALDERGLADAFELVHFRRRAWSKGQDGPADIVFTRKDNGREAEVPLAIAIPLLHQQANWDSVEDIWDEFKSRGLTVNKATNRRASRTGAPAWRARSRGEPDRGEPDRGEPDRGR